MFDSWMDTIFFVALSMMINIVWIMILSAKQISKEFAAATPAVRKLIFSYSVVAVILVVNMFSTLALVLMMQKTINYYEDWTGHIFSYVHVGAIVAMWLAFAVIALATVVGQREILRMVKTEKQVGSSEPITPKV